MSCLSFIVPVCSPVVLPIQVFKKIILTKKNSLGFSFNFFNFHIAIHFTFSYVYELVWRIFSFISCVPVIKTKKFINEVKQLPLIIKRSSVRLVMFIYILIETGRFDIK